MNQDFFQLISWIGVVFLTVAHAGVSFGLSKKSASWLSAAGAAISVVASAGLAIWSVFAFNLCWAAISVWGSRIKELATPSALKEGVLILLSCVPIGLWTVGPEAVSWAGSMIFVSAWLAFSAGIVTRLGYLSSCVLVGLAISPAFLSLGGHAFAANEALAAVLSFSGVWREIRDRKLYRFGRAVAPR